MFSVEEICGIPGIKRKLLETLERCERRPRPFPAIPNKICHAEVALTLRVRPDGNRLPSLKIKIAVPLSRWFRSPGIRAFASAASSVCGAMPLRFAGQFFSGPTCVGRRFIVAYIHGRI